VQNINQKKQTFTVMFAALLASQAY